MGGLASLLQSNSILMNYKDIVKQFRDENAWGLSTSIDLVRCNPETIRSEAALKKYVIELCDHLKMKRFQETTIVHFGQDERVAGFSMMQLIETSGIMAHFCNKTDNAYIDIFSCKVYDPYKATYLTQSYFEAENASINVCLRK